MNFDELVEKAVAGTAFVVIAAFVLLFVIGTIPYLTVALLFVVGVGMLALVLFILVFFVLLLWDCARDFVVFIRNLFSNDD